jgi:hypothetical protein
MGILWVMICGSAENCQYIDRVRIHVKENLGRDSGPIDPGTDRRSLNLNQKTNHRSVFRVGGRRDLNPQPPVPQVGRRVHGLVD